MKNTAEQVSYRVDQVSKNIKTEVERLKAQVELFWEKEQRIYNNYGLSDGMTVLECGSGPGHLLEKMMQHYPNSAVTGVELDPYLVEFSREYLKKNGHDRFKVHQGSVTELKFPENTYDIVVARLLLEHLPDPVKAAAEIYKVLKPGGKAFIVDNDFEVHLKTFPDIAELGDLYDAYCRARISEGGNPKIGRQLPSILKKAFFINIDIDTIIAHSKIIGDDIFMVSEGSGIPAKLVEDGFLSAQVMERIATKWYDMLLEEDHAIFRQLFITVGEKGTEEQRAAITDDQKNKINIAAVDDTGDSRTPETFKSNSIVDYEKKMSMIWCDALKLEKVDPDDNFFDLGGNSMLAVRIIRSMNRTFARKSSVTDLFQYLTINALSKYLFSDSTDEKIARPVENIEDRAKRKREAIKRRRMQSS